MLASDFPSENPRTQNRTILIQSRCATFENNLNIKIMSDKDKPKKPTNQTQSTSDNSDLGTSYVTLNDQLAGKKKRNK